MTREAELGLQIQCSGTVTNILDEAATRVASDPIGESVALLSFLTGTDEEQINRAIFKKSFEIAADSFVDVDVYDFAGFDSGAGDGVDGLGQPQAWDQVVGIFVILQPGSEGALRIGGEASTAAFNSPWDGNDSARNIIRASTNMPGLFLISSPAADAFEVTDAANHLLRLFAVGGSATVTLLLWGRDS